MLSGIVGNQFNFARIAFLSKFAPPKYLFSPYVPRPYCDNPPPTSRVDAIKSAIQPIQRAGQPLLVFVREVGVNACRLQRFVAEQFLHVVNISASLQ